LHKRKSISLPLSIASSFSSTFSVARDCHKNTLEGHVMPSISDTFGQPQYPSEMDLRQGLEYEPYSFVAYGG